MLHRQRGGSGGGNGAAAEAQRWQCTCEGEGGVGTRVFAEGVRWVPWRCLYRLGRGGGAAPRRPWPSMAFGLDCNQEGEGIKRENCRLMGESEDRASLRLDGEV
jgi:hypothetical protein